jgi:hypothetical protein
MLIRVNMDGIGPIVATDTIEITVTVEVDWNGEFYEQK